MSGPHRRPRQQGVRLVQVRLSETELAGIREAAAAPGRRVSTARFIAEAAVAAAGVPVSRVVQGAPTRLALAEIAEAVAAVSRVGNNLNQLARERNVTGVRPAATDAAVGRVHEALDRLATAVEGAHPYPDQRDTQ